MRVILIAKKLRSHELADQHSSLQGGLHSWSFVQGIMIFPIGEEFVVHS